MIQISLRLIADYTTNRYVSLRIRDRGVDRRIDLSGYAIVPEVKFNKNALEITLESENLWSNCGAAGPFEYRVLYDQVHLRSLRARR